MIRSVLQLFVYLICLASVYAVLPPDPTGEPTSAPSSLPTYIPYAWENEGSLVTDSFLTADLPSGGTYGDPFGGFTATSLATFLNSRGTATFAVTAPTSGSVSIFTSNFYEGERTYLITSVLEDATNAVEYGDAGADIRVIGDKVTGPLAFFHGSVQDDDGDIDILVYARGSLAKWSVQQYIAPASTLVDLGNDGTNFAQTFGADRHDLRTLAVGASDAEFTASGKGAVFVYETTNPGVKSFSLQQTLYTDSLYNALGKSFVDIYDKTIIAGAARISPSVDATLVFTKAPNGIWSQQQQLTFTGSSQNAVRATVYEDSITVGYPSVTVGLLAGAGAVEVYEPSKPTPKKPVQWSLAQRLIALFPEASEGFGVGVATDGNTLAVGSAGTEYNLYIFKKVNKKWTAHAQMFSGASTGISSLWVQGNLAVSRTTSDIDVWNDNTAWDCLYVSLGDHFGDGWGSASLRVETPFGEVDTFGTDCAATNPFVFRYCPSYQSQDGVYKFSIADPAAAFNWEIFWKVYVESEGRWISGDATTQLDFIFDSEKLAFKAGALRRDVGNATCTECAQKPQPKAKSLPNRKLQATPGPTFLQTDYGDWQLFTSTGAGVDDWFSADSQGVFYSIADLKGQRLFHKNTFCPATLNEPNPVRSCWNHLPDGEYVLRVSSGLARNTDSLSRTWTFCNTQGVDGSQLAFRIGNHSTTCSPLYKYSIESYCHGVLKAFSIVDIQLFIGGVKLSDASALSSADLSVLLQAVQSVQTGVTDVSVLGVHKSETGTLMSIELTIDMSSLGVEGRDTEAMSNFESNLYEKMSSHTDRIWSVLASNANTQSTSFIAATFASLVNFQFVDVEFDNPSVSSTKEDAFTFENAVAQSNNALPASTTVEVTTTTSSSAGDNIFLLASSYGGYALAVLVAAVALVVVLRKAMVTGEVMQADVIEAKNAPVEHIDAMELGSPKANNAVEDAIEEIPVRQESDEASSEESEEDEVDDEQLLAYSREKKAINPISLQDMLKMVQDEDEMLAKAREIGHF